MKILLIPLFILSSLAAHAQVNTDSLLHELLYSGKFKHAGPVNYLLETFQKFKTADGFECYDLCIDSGNKLNEYIGLSIIYKQRDKEGRLTKLIGYNKKGEYSYWDFSPITSYTYLTDTVITEHYDYDYVLEDKKTEVRDKQQLVVETLHYDKDRRLKSRVVKNYNDVANELFIKYYDGNGKLTPDNFGKAIIRQKFDLADKESPAEEYFYDAVMKLVDGDHENLVRNGFTVLKYSQIKKTMENGETIKSYYNSTGALVCKETFGVITGRNTMSPGRESCVDEIRF